MTSAACHDDRLVRDSDAWAADEGFLREVLLTAFERRRFQTEVINAMPLYPTEAVLWDENQVPSTHYTGRASVWIVDADDVSSAWMAAMGRRPCTLRGLSCQ